MPKVRHEPYRRPSAALRARQRASRPAFSVAGSPVRGGIPRHQAAGERGVTRPRGRSGASSEAARPLRSAPSPTRRDALFRHHRQAPAEVGKPHRVRHLHGLADAVADTPFDATTFRMFPEDWLASAPGVRMTSALVRVELLEDESAISQKMAKWFVPESLAVSRVIDDTAIIASDFRIDSQSHMRMAVFARPGVGQRRIGRVVQRLCEIETYKTMSMLGLARVRDLGPRLGAADEELTQLIEQMAGETVDPDQTLKSLLAVAAELEKILAQSSFRFGATGAYEALVSQRIGVLREERFEGRQTFGEFMMRRFDPAMRTVKATERRLQAMADRAAQAGNLLRTRVDVDRSAQNQKLLESMDKRADLQLRLQRTVEGLSVVAISYYAVNLAIYVLGPVGREAGVSNILLTAVVTPVVVLGVWGVVRRIRRSVE